MMFKVTKVFDGDTFEIYPRWNWNDNTGNIVGLKGIKFRVGTGMIIPGISWD
jgi:hypothetical protein